MTITSQCPSDRCAAIVAGVPQPELPPWRAASWRYIVDLDGTLIRNGAALPGAAPLLEALAGRYAIVSNNSTDTAAGLSRKLHRMGLAVAPAHLVLAGEMTVDWLARTSPDARVLLLGSPTLRRHAQRMGCRLVAQGADVVLLARDPCFSYGKLSAAVNALRAGARLVVTNPDISHPGDNGTCVPETGTLLAALTACAEVQPECVIGKPSAALFREGLRRLQARPAQALMIGDNPATDAVGAIAMGMSFLLLGTGPGAEAKTPAQLLDTWCTGRKALPSELNSV
ncbi:HAD-IIA family hydrolase [Cupriavidus sp. BIC8F]|uniref:HAD-IIA family hydrolase n=1 Tax=Cupriavidus sp. BIC8F TaxID=3079014 RepID=UPI002916C4FA|nr:HAD-IIA family hydrolase [Cupriavidus sp. BIC8F]